MELLSASKVNKLSLFNRNVYDFLVRSYNYYINCWLGLTTQLLDEYIYFMNKNYEMYGNRIINNDFELDIDDVSIYHIPNFVSLIKNSTESNMEIVVDFYSQIMDAIDNFLGIPYFYGTTLTEKQQSNFGKQFRGAYNRSMNLCPCKETIIFFSHRDKDEFICDDFDEYNLTRAECIVSRKHYGIIFEGRMRFDELWKLLNCCHSTIFFKINWNKTDKDALILRPVYSYSYDDTGFAPEGKNFFSFMSNQ